LSELAARLKVETAASEAEQAQHALLAADIKRFLKRAADPMKPMPAPDAPPGAPIGDPGMDWLAPAPPLFLERRASGMVLTLSAAVW